MTRDNVDILAGFRLTPNTRRVEKVDGLLYNVEFDKNPDVKDPGKQN